jgi:hypothetical protein
MALKPPKYVKAVRDLIFWLYAELIAKASGFGGNYGFAVSRYRKPKIRANEMVIRSAIQRGVYVAQRHSRS